MGKFPRGGGGGRGSAAWEFFPHNPVFLSDHDPYWEDYFSLAQGPWVATTTRILGLPLLPLQILL